MRVVDPDDDLAGAGTPMSPSITSRTRRSGSGPKSLAMSANAPSGTLRADEVPMIQCRRALGGPHAATASRATRVLPTPAKPDKHDPVRALASRPRGLGDNRKLLGSPDQRPPA